MASRVGTVRNQTLKHMKARSLSLELSSGAMHTSSLSDFLAGHIGDH